MKPEAWFDGSDPAHPVGVRFEAGKKRYISLADAKALLASLDKAVDAGTRAAMGGVVLGVLCHCGKQVKLNKDGRRQKHRSPSREWCRGGGCKPKGTAERPVGAVQKGWRR